MTTPDITPVDQPEDQPLHDPTQLDRADIPASELEFRAWRPSDGDKIMLEAPEYIRYHDDYQLQKRNPDGTWSTFLLSASTSDDDAPQENIE